MLRRLLAFPFDSVLTTSKRSTVPVEGRWVPPSACLSSPRPSSTFVPTRSWVLAVAAAGAVVIEVVRHGCRLVFPTGTADQRSAAAPTSVAAPTPVTASTSVAAPTSVALAVFAVDLGGDLRCDGFGVDRLAGLRSSFNHISDDGVDNGLHVNTLFGSDVRHGTACIESRQEGLLIDTQNLNQHGDLPGTATSVAPTVVRVGWDDAHGG